MGSASARAKQSLSLLSHSQQFSGRLRYNARASRMILCTPRKIAGSICSIVSLVLTFVHCYSAACLQYESRCPCEAFFDEEHQRVDKMMRGSRVDVHFVG